MTQEEKELLLKDLCARTPYGVKFAFSKNVYTIKGVDLIVTNEGGWEYAVTAKGIEPIEIGFIKPYLRPMSSMTEEEKEELWKAIDKDTDIIMANMDAPIISIYKGRVYRGELIHYEYEFLISHHFDYRGLIPMGLALEAPEGIYKI